MRVVFGNIGLRISGIGGGWMIFNFNFHLIFFFFNFFVLLPYHLKCYHIMFIILLLYFE